METEEMEIEKIKKIKIPKELKGILKKFDDALEKRKDFELEFNVFSLISNTYHRENFHSDIIAAFLRKEKHNGGNRYLREFIKLIKKINNKDKSILIDENDFLNSEITREEGRIDILIKGDKKAIIIENKINNANDMENQLPKYHDYVIKKYENYEVVAIVYLPLNKDKIPDQTTWVGDQNAKDKIISKLIHLVAYDEKGSDLVNGWIEPCIALTNDIDTLSILRQYSKLIKHLRGYIMETEALKKYYDYISNLKNKKLEEIQSLIQIQKELINYYPEKLKEEINKGENRNPIFNKSEIPSEYKCILRLTTERNFEDYYFQIIFKNNTECEIELRDNLETWRNEDKLKAYTKFTDKFKPLKNSWVYNTKYNFTNDDHWKNFVTEVKDILNLVSEKINS